jgi:DNA-binding winged helix-turn-helix (wHTH) protein
MALNVAIQDVNRASHVEAPGEAYTFGPFWLDPAARRLERAGAPVDVGSRALDILIALVRRAGSVVSQRELMSIVWR